MRSFIYPLYLSSDLYSCHLIHKNYLRFLHSHLQISFQVFGIVPHPSSIICFQKRLLRLCHLLLLRYSPFILIPMLSDEVLNILLNNTNLEVEMSIITSSDWFKVFYTYIVYDREVWLLEIYIVRIWVLVPFLWLYIFLRSNHKETHRALGWSKAISPKGVRSK